MEFSMMKPIVLSALFALAACAGSDGKGDTANSNPVKSTADTACEQEIALECEEGFVDNCLLAPESATTHSCVEGELPDPAVVPEDVNDVDTGDLTDEGDETDEEAETTEE
jgi:hypothetical protein